MRSWAAVVVGRGEIARSGELQFSRDTAGGHCVSHRSGVESLDPWRLRRVNEFTFSPLPAPTTVNPTSSLGGWHIAGEISRGPSATVYLARSEDGTVAALKVLSPDADATARERFLRERAVLARLHHPRIPPLLDDGVAEDGTLWLATGFVEGATLGTHLRRGSVGGLDLSLVVEQVGDALAHAHAHGVVHRDLSPHNIICTEQGAYLIDLGIAHHAEMGALTTDATALGTLGFAAPEQLDGGRCSEESDIYGLAAVVFTVLIGQPPHPGERPAEILARRLRGDREHVFGRTPEGRVIAGLIESALQAGPYDRPSEIGAWSRALADALAVAGSDPREHVAVAASQATTSIELPRGAPRHLRRRTVAAAAVAAAGAAIVAAVGGVDRTPKAAKPVPLAELTSGRLTLPLPTGWIRLAPTPAGDARGADPRTGATLMLRTRVGSTAPGWSAATASVRGPIGVLVWHRATQARVVLPTAVGAVVLDCTGGPEIDRSCTDFLRRARGAAPIPLSSAGKLLRRAGPAIDRAGRTLRVAKIDRGDAPLLRDRAATARSAAAALRRDASQTGWWALPELRGLARALERAATAMFRHERTRSAASWAALRSAYADQRAAILRARRLVPIDRPGRLLTRREPTAQVRAGASSQAPATPSAASSSPPSAGTPSPNDAADESQSSKRPDSGSEPTAEEPIVVGPAL